MRPAPLVVQAQQPTPSEVPDPTAAIQGDPATARFGLFFLGTLAVLLIAVGVGIGVGNMSHYKYFGPYDQRTLFSNLTNLTFLNAA